MNESLVSVVITTYKRDVKYVKEALDSAANQTYEPIQIVLVDDNGTGSSYESSLKELCAMYCNVEYLPNVRNSGAQFSRNQGILHTKGEYVAFLDDDDIWVKTKIKKQMELFTDPSVGMVFCDGYSFKDNNLNKLSEFREVSVYDRPITHNMELFNDYVGSTSQALIRKECFSMVGLFDCDMPARQDYEMWLRISKHYKIVGTPERLLYYRIHSGERISTNWGKCYKSYALLLEKYHADYERQKYAKAKLILRLSATAFKNDNYFQGCRDMCWAFFTSPRCLIDVVARKLRKKSFQEFYTMQKLSDILK